MDDKDLADIIERNPNIDPKKVVDALQALRELRQAGLAKQPGYNIEAPFSRPMKRATEQPLLSQKPGATKS